MELKIEEYYIHYLWKHKYIGNYNLFTQDNKKIQILDFGFQNIYEGPDFINCKIRIDNIIWVGNVEIHIKSSDWYAHNHQLNPKYDNVILHIVLINDKEIFQNNKKLNTVEIIDFINKEHYIKYKSFVKYELSCSSHLFRLDDFIIENFKNRLLIERLESKNDNINNIFHKLNKNWEETLYYLLLSAFGSPSNSIAFEQLATSLPYKLLKKYLDKHDDLEALLYGQSGLLENSKDKDIYVTNLKSRYNYLKEKHNIHPIDYNLWNMGRIRPQNYPTIRINQLYLIMKDFLDFFSYLIEEKNEIFNIKKKFNVNIREGYWHNHYIFDKISINKNKGFGPQLINTVIINAILPLMFYYGKRLNKEIYCELAIENYYKLEFEKNNITNKFDSKLNKINAGDSQSLIHLYKNYCSKKKCLSCDIGLKILN